MGVIQNIVAFIKSTLFILSGLLKRAACFIKKKKVDEVDPTSVLVIPNSSSTNKSSDSANFSSTNSFHANQYLKTNGDIQSDWNSWGMENESDVSAAHLTAGDEEENTEIDYFKDMEPQVKVNKVLVVKKQMNYSNSSRLAVHQDLDFTLTGELNEWTDEEAMGGWEDEVNLDLNEAEILREARQQRRAERQTKAKNQRQEKYAPRHQTKLANKVT